MASACRTCLSFSNKMHDVGDTQLRETFERVTNKRFNAGLGLCYLCYAQLKKCCKFADMSWKSEVILTELVNKGVEINQEMISRFGLTKTSTFSVTPVDYFYSGFKESSGAVVKADTGITEYEVLVKEEIKETEDGCEQHNPTEELRLKEDINTEGDITVYDNCELIAKSEETIPSAEYIDIKCNEKDDLPITNITISNNKEKLLFNCSICCKTYNIKGNLKRHMQVHTRENYTCDYCQRSFNSKNLIRKHMKIHQKPHNCMLCEKTFREKCFLKRHLKIHSKKRPYICHLCGKAFTDKAGLKRHSTTHAEIREIGIKTYDCNICNKIFYRNSHLELHMRTHTKLKPYTCSVCNHSCTQKCSLKEHMRIHTDERRHYCTECNKFFLRKSHLRRHLSFHTREKLNEENM